MLKTYKYFLVSIFLLMSCSRDGGFLYYVSEKATPERFSFSHKLKELQSENRIDIVWVIDNSGSMGVYQQAVISNADHFIQQFVKGGGLDWRMAVLSTDDADAPYVGMAAGTELDKGTSNAIGVFQNAVARLGTSGSAVEKTFTPILKALGSYPQFVRPDAILAFIVVTDAKEQSDLPAQDFLNEMVRIKDSLNRVIMYGVFASKDLSCKSEEGEWDFKGSPYEEIVKPTKGKVYPLCSPNFGTNLAALGNDLVTRVKRPRLRLKKRPDPKTIQLVFKGNVLPGGPKEAGGYWIYDFELNALIFHDLDFAQNDIEEVQVSFVEAS